MKYRQEYDNKWFYPKRSKWLMRCCDCGLVHNVEFRIQTLEVRMTRNKKETKIARMPPPPKREKE